MPGASEGASRPCGDRPTPSLLYPAAENAVDAKVTTCSKPPFQTRLWRYATHEAAPPLDSHGEMFPPRSTPGERAKVVELTSPQTRTAFWKQSVSTTGFFVVDGYVVAKATVTPSAGDEGGSSVIDGVGDDFAADAAVGPTVNPRLAMTAAPPRNASKRRIINASPADARYGAIFPLPGLHRPRQIESLAACAARCHQSNSSHRIFRITFADLAGARGLRGEQHESGRRW
jgi:hypothetical protein